jgi:F5/8 type C domain
MATRSTSFTPTARLAACSCLLGILAAGHAFANPLPIASYSMENGESGSQTYYDDTYGGVGSTGNPNASGSFLSGGRGQLTNGVFAVGTDIFDDEWVGWANIQPTITIDLGSAYAVNSIGFHASNWSPPFNDVGAPGSANLSYSLDNISYTPLGTYLTTVADRSGDDPRWVDLPFGVTARYVRAQLFDGNKESGTAPGGKPWIFLDEARADGIVPEPPTLVLLSLGTLATIFSRRRATPIHLKCLFRSQPLRTVSRL